MKGDFTRSTFHRPSHYTRVQMQQGRVELDADWNEQAEIEAHLRRAPDRDIIGVCGVPLERPAFKVSTALLPSGGRDLYLDNDLTAGAQVPGHAYVDGELVEVEGSEVQVLASIGGPASWSQIVLASLSLDGQALAAGQALRLTFVGGGIFDVWVTAVTPDSPDDQVTITFTPAVGADPATARLRRRPTFRTQPYRASVEDLDALTPTNQYVVWVDRWDRHVTPLEDEALREVALGGADTTTRARALWQVKLSAVPTGTTITCGTVPWSQILPARTGRIRARATPTETADNPCIVAESAGYGGLENQLYRVEIHTGGPLGTATWKWSRENGSIVTRWLGQASSAPTSADYLKLEVESLGRDERLGFKSGDWVELFDERHVLSETPGSLYQVEDVVEDSQGRRYIVILDPSATLPVYSAWGSNPRIRRWDMASSVDASLGLATPVAPEWIELETGVEVRFEPGTYQSGDHWLIPARVVTADVEWPRADVSEGGDGLGEPLALPPHGIEHRACCLAILRHDGGLPGSWVVEDCRALFPSLTDLVDLSFAGGDGQEVVPDANPATLVQLPAPVEVAVTNGRFVVAGAAVRFRTIPLPPSGVAPPGVLEDTLNVANDGDDITVLTGPDGVARAWWRMSSDPAFPVQRLEATLLDADPSITRHPLHFNAFHAVDALELEYLGGDGQEVAPQASPYNRTRLPERFEVGVARGGRRVAGAPVRFRVVPVHGSTALPPNARLLFEDLSTGGLPQDITAVTDGNGVARVFLEMDTSETGRIPNFPVQRVEATLADVAVQPPRMPIHFTANLSHAALVAYHGECQTLAASQTVQQALDALCEALGSVEDPGVKVVEIQIWNPDGGQNPTPTPLLNDRDYVISQLVPGIRFKLDKQLDPQSLRCKPVVTVTLELPDTWGQTTSPQYSSFYRPVVVAGTLGIMGNWLEWKPTPTALWWLTNQEQYFPYTMDELRGRRLLVRVRLDGDFIWAAGDPTQNLDGPLFGAPAADGVHTDAVIGVLSGDGRRGGAVNLWFWLREDTSSYKSLYTLTPDPSWTNLGNGVWERKITAIYIGNSGDPYVNIWASVSSETLTNPRPFAFQFGQYTGYTDSTTMAFGYQPYEFRIRYHDPGSAPPPQRGVVTITSTDLKDACRMIELYVDGSGSRLSYRPGVLSFHVFGVRETPPEEQRPVTVSVHGSSVALRRLSVESEEAGVFTLAGTRPTRLPRTLQPGDLEVMVRFRPPKIQGQWRGTVVVVTDDPETPELRIPIVGRWTREPAAKPVETPQPGTPGHPTSFEGPRGGGPVR